MLPPAQSDGLAEYVGGTDQVLACHIPWAPKQLEQMDVIDRLSQNLQRETEASPAYAGGKS